MISYSIWTYPPHYRFSPPLQPLRYSHYFFMPLRQPVQHAPSPPCLDSDEEDLSSASEPNQEEMDDSDEDELVTNLRKVTNL